VRKSWGVISAQDRCGVLQSQQWVVPSHRSLGKALCQGTGYGSQEYLGARAQPSTLGSTVRTRCQGRADGSLTPSHALKQESGWRNGEHAR
jgi:hypothetical protein